MKLTARNSAKPSYPTFLEARASAPSWLGLLGAAAIGASSLSACAIPEVSAAERVMKAARPDAGAPRDAGTHSPDAGTPKDAAATVYAKKTVIVFDDANLFVDPDRPFVQGTFIQTSHARWEVRVPKRLRFETREEDLP